MEVKVDKDHNGRLAEERYSICSAARPSDKGKGDVVEIMVKRNIRSELNKFFIWHCKKGQRVTVRGGMGNFVYEAKDGDKIAFLVGGIGFHPILSMIRTLMEKPEIKADMYVFYMV
jgi:ferredoxin-NADP reductase